MRDPHIYRDEKNQTISCTNCGESETAVDYSFKRFKFVDYEYNKNIVNPSSTNPDMKWRVVCPGCGRKTKASFGPFYYY